MLNEKNGVSYVSFDIFAPFGSVVAAVSTRKGGVSVDGFSSLNMSFSSGDDADNIYENRSRFLSLFGIDSRQIICCNQVHGTNITQASSALCGRGAMGRDNAIPDCDGLMTNEANVPITMNFADCTPLLFYGPVHTAIAVSHGGWRGTAQNIDAVTLAKMHAAYGTQAKDVLVAIGPAIGSCCFEVGQDVIDAFSSLFLPDEMKTLAKEKGDGKYLFDLPTVHKKLLLRAGVTEDHIESSGLCTYCHNDLFYSYRKATHEGIRTGRHMAVMMLRDEE